MKSRRVIIATITFGALLVVYGLDCLWVSRVADRKAEERRVVLLTANEIREFEIKREEDGMRLERSGERWNMIAPSPMRIDQAGVLSLLGNLAGATRHHAFATDAVADLSTYGLDDPKLSIRIKGRNLAPDGSPQSDTDTETTLLIGSPSAGGEYYAMIDGGDEAFTIGGFLRNLIDRPPGDLRQRSVLVVDIARIRAITINNEHGDTVVKQTGVGEWRVVEPSSFPADDGRIKQLVEQLALSQILWFDDDLTSTTEELGLDAPTLTVTVAADTVDSDNVTTHITASRIEIGRREPKTRSYVARASNGVGVFHVSEDIVDDLTIAPGDLRLRQVFDFVLSDVVRLESTMGRSHIALVREPGADWRFNGKTSPRVLQDKANSLLNDLAFIEAEDFILDQATTQAMESRGLDPPMREFLITTRVSGKETTHRLIAGARHGQSSAVYAMVDDSPVLMTVRFDRPGRFITTERQFADYRLLPDLQNETFSRIDVSVGESRIVLTRSDEGWQTAPSDGSKPTPVKDGYVQSIMVTLGEIEPLDQLKDDVSLVLKARNAGLDVEIEAWRRGQDDANALPVLTYAAGSANADGQTVVIQVDGSYYLIYFDAADGVRSVAEFILSINERP